MADPSPDLVSLPPVAGRAAPLRRIAAALAFPNFRKLWFGAATSSIGTWMQSVAQNWLVLTLSGSAFYLGLDAFLAQLPILLFTLIGGVVADRYDRRRVLLGSQYVQMTTAFTLAVLVGTGAVRVWQILALSFVTGCAQAFGGPAHQSLMPSLVDRERLPNAIALNSIQFNLARVIGPLLAGLALASLGMVFCFTANGVSFLAVIAALWTLKVPPREEAAPPLPLAQDLRIGLRYVRREGPLFGLTLLAFAVTFLGTPLLTLLPVFAQNVFHLGVEGYSRMMVFSGAGAVTGAITVAWLGRFPRMGTWALAIQVLFGGLIVAFALARVPALSHLMLFAAGAALIIVFSLMNSLVQLIAPNHMRGRVMSIYMVAFRGGMPLGSLASGYLANRLSAPTALVINGILLVVVAAVFLVRFEKLRSV